MRPTNVENRPKAQSGRVRRLLPAKKVAFTASGCKDGAMSTMPLTPKSPRCGVSIACNRCRLKKTRCNGAKPACASCSKTRQDCIYTPTAANTKNGDLLVEPIRLLDSFTSSQASAMISSLRGIDDPAIISKSLRQATEAAKQAGTYRKLPLCPDANRLREFSGHKEAGSRPHGPPSGDGPTQGSFHRQAMALEQDVLCSSSTDTQPRATSRFWNDVLHTDSGDLNGTTQSGCNQILALLGVPQVQPGLGTWSTVTRDVCLIQHLLALYFCWEYPVTATLSKDHFLRDFWEGRSRYCSPLLVNALLALSCRFSRKSPMQASIDDMHTLGDHFFEECQRLLCLPEEDPPVTTIQALGIMSLREASCGRYETSCDYSDQSIRLAMDLDQSEKAGSDADERIVRSVTFWGAFAHDQALALCRSKLPFPSRSSRQPLKPGKIANIEALLWEFYSDDGLSVLPSAPQVSNVRSVFNGFCELSEVVHRSMYAFHSPGTATTSQDLLDIHMQYLEWHSHLPKALRLEDNFTPAVLFTHIYYHHAILLLFRPLSKHTILGSSVLPRDVCSQAADSIQGLLRSYSTMYTLRHTPALLPQLTLAAATMRLAIRAQCNAASMEQKPEREPAEHLNEWANITCAVRQGLHDLKAMSLHHEFAGQALESLNCLAKTWRIGTDAPDAGVPLQSHTHGAKHVTISLDWEASDLKEEDFLRA